MSRWAAAVVLFALAPTAPAAAQAFRFPSSCWDGCMTVTAYYDYGGRRDWNCGSNTYSGHRGTDFAPYGSFTAMDEGRGIVAAADGEVTAAHDGEFDRCTTGSCAGGGGFGNYVAIRHADGKVVYYAHMKRGTVAVSIGARVTCGQQLGQIGSSGYSTGPHLHYEPRVSGSADDPFGGVAGCSGPESWWVEQRAYRTLPSQSCETTTPPPVDDAAVESVEPAAGTAVTTGASFTARVTMHNTGNTTWSDGENILFTYDGGERMDAPEQVVLGGASVAPDGRHTFELTLVAPAEPGEHAVLLRMDRYGTSRFGAVAEVRILAELPPVDPDAGTPPPTDAGTDPELPPDAGTIDPGGDASMGTRTGDRSFSGDDATLTGGCSAGGAGGEGRAPAWAALTLVAAIALRRRRG